MVFMCASCGYPGLSDEPGRAGNFEICPSCGFQFSVTDDDKGFTYAQWRELRIRNGMIWDKGRSQPPKGWDPVVQLKNLEKQ